MPIEDGWADVVISNGVVNLCPDKLEVFRDLVSEYEQEHDVPAADIAAALAVMAQDGQPLLMEPEPAPEAKP